MPNDTIIDDHLLVSRAKEGRGEAFGILYERYVANIYRYLFSHTGDRQDAEDMTEDVFLRAWRSIGNYQEQGVPFLAYLFRIARHVLIDHYRRAGSESKKISTEDILLSDNRPGPADTIGASMENAQVHLALKSLRDDYRQVLSLRFLADLTPEETAQVMGRSAGAIRVLQHRALLAMRQKMKEL